jgi:hypothetical protein
VKYDPPLQLPGADANLLEEDIPGPPLSAAALHLHAELGRDAAGNTEELEHYELVRALTRWHDHTLTIIYQQQISILDSERIDPTCKKDQTPQLPFYYLTAKLHKPEVATRGISASGNVPMTALSIWIDFALQVVIRTLHTLWCNKLLEVGIDTPGCPIIPNSKEVRRRLPNIPFSPAAESVAPGTTYTQRHHIETADFGTLYTTLPHADLLDKVKQTIALAFDFKAQHSPGTRSIEIVVSRRDRRGRPVLEKADWSTRPATTPATTSPYPRNHYRNRTRTPPESSTCKRLNVARLRKWIDILLRNTFVDYHGTIYQQVIGIAMGTNCAPNLANTYLFYYEYQYLCRRITTYKSLRSAVNWYHIHTIARLTRYIDDILSFNAPGGLAAIMYDKRLIQGDGHDGIYPWQLTGPHNSVIIQPLKLSIVHSGDKADYMDMTLSQTWLTQEHRGRWVIDSTLYSKYDDMPVLQALRRPFPHLQTALANACKYNVVFSQLCRFVDICSKYYDILDHLRTLVQQVINHGYDRNQIRKLLETPQALARVNSGNFRDVRLPLPMACWRQGVGYVMTQR